MEGPNAIAIVGVGCRFPGADNLDEYWRVLVNGEDHVMNIPEDRWNQDAFNSSDASDSEKSDRKAAGFLKSYKAWDNKLYGIIDMEAVKMDPQQRFVLDCVYMALENAGFSRSSIKGTQTGVYLGHTNADYKDVANGDMHQMDHYVLTGTSPSIISARVSYVFNLQGPSLILDSAGSSSIVAVHMACQALRSGEIEIAICGGVNCILTPDLFIPNSEARMTSPTGKCRTLSDAAEGQSRGEGCGILILKRLPEAEEDGNLIWATIATGCNQDGNTASPATAPSGVQQRAIVEHVISSYSINPLDISYIETHGTGTFVGDEIEFKALSDYFNEFKPKKRYIGSVRSNIGHLQSAAGLAGLIKTLLMMRHGKIVPSLHFSNPSRALKMESSNFLVPTSTFDWPNHMEKMACVNSFSFGGTNGHAILKLYCPAPEDLEEEENKNYIVCFSALTAASLLGAIKTTENKLQGNRYSLASVAYTSSCLRDHYPIRLAVVSKSADELRKTLSNVKESDFSPAVKVGRRVVFVFCGMGTYFKGMCLESMEVSRTFREKMEEFDSLLHPYTGWSLIQQLRNPDDSLDSIFKPIAVVASQVAQAAVWKEWGICPDAVVGQSVGEVTAAHVGGYLTLEETVRLIYLRTIVMVEATGGKMFVVQHCPLQYVEEILSKYEGQACVAVYNSGVSCTVSGDKAALEKIRTELKDLDEAENLKLILRDLPVSSAFHSHHMDTASEELLNKLTNLTGQDSGLPLYSTVTGDLVDPGTLKEASHWAQNLRQPVLLSKAIANAADSEEFNIFLELGPRPILAAHLSNIIPSSTALALPSFQPNRETSCMYNTLRTLYQKGINPLWKNMYDIRPGVADIPKYCFDFKNYLFVPTASKMKLDGFVCLQKFHPFVSKPFYDDKRKFRLTVSSLNAKFAYLKRVANVRVMADVTCVEVAVLLGLELIEPFGDFSAAVEFRNSFVPRTGMTEELDVCVEPMYETNSGFRFFVKQHSTVYASGTLNKCPEYYKSSKMDVRFNVKQIRSRCPDTLSKTKFYVLLELFGFSYEEDFKLVGPVSYNSTESLGYIDISSTLTNDDNQCIILHPVVMDSILQMSCTIEPEINEETVQLVPSAIDRLTLIRQLEGQMLVYSHKTGTEKNRHYYNIYLLSLDGKLILEIENYAVQHKDRTEKENSTVQEVQWKHIFPLPSLSNGSEPEKAATFLLIYNNPTVFERIDVAFEWDSIISFNAFEAMKTMASEEMWAHLSDLVTNNSVAAILFYPKYPIDDVADLSAAEVHEKVLEECLVLKEIISAITNKSMLVTLFVLTENTQNICSGSENYLTDIFGLPLWGMTRSFLKEMNGNVVKLIDFCQCNRKKLGCVPKILNLCLNGSLSQYSEIVVNDNGVYSNEIYPVNQRQEAEMRRWNWYDERCCVRLNATSLRGEHFYFSYEKKEACLPVPEPSMVLRVDYVCLDTCWVLHEVENANDVGYQVIGREFVGSEVTKKNGSNVSGETFVVFQPVRVSSYVTVLRSCAVPVKDLTPYAPGCVDVLFRLWLMAKEVSKDCDATILFDDETEEEADVLRSMLTCLGVPGVGTVRRESILHENKKGFSLIVLTTLSKEKLALLDSLFEEVLVLEPFLKNAKGTLTEISLLTAKVRVLKTEELFSMRGVSSSLPKLCSWIRKNKQVYSKYVHGKGQSVSRLTPPCNVPGLELKDSLEDRAENIFSLPCMVIEFQDSNTNRRSESGKAVPVGCGLNHLFREDAIYVVVGCSGWNIVNLLAEMGAGHIVTLSSNKLSKNKGSEVENPQDRHGFRLMHFPVDITDFNALKSAMNAVSRSFPNIPVKGIFFADTTSEDGLLLFLDKERFCKAMCSKVVGVWNFHLLSLKYTLDYFVIHSSLTSMIGNAGQTNYGAGNSFMDGLAHYRRQLGFPGQAINWGAFDSIMDTKDEKIVVNLKRQGILFLNKEEIRKCFIHALLSNKPQVMYGKIDWMLMSLNLTRTDVYLQIRHRYKTVISDLITVNSNLLKPVSNTTLDVELLLSMYPLERRKALTQYLFALISQLLLIEKNTLGLDSSFLQLGLDSVSAIAIATQLQTDTRCAVPVTLLLAENASLQTLLDHIESNISAEKHEEELEETLEEDATLDSDYGQISYMEYFVYREYQRCPTNIAQHGYFDLRIPKHSASSELWKKIMQTLMRMYRNLRTVYIPLGTWGKRAHVKKRIMPEDFPIDYTVVEGSEDKISNSLELMTNRRFDLSVDLPFRAIFTVGLKRPVLRVVLHNICFDTALVNSLLADVARISLHFQNKDSLPRIPYKESATDPAAAMKMVLSEQQESLLAFWKRSLPKTLVVNSLADDSTSNLPGPFKTIAQALSPEACRGITKINSEEGITVFQFMTLLYQLTLYVFTKQDPITVSTAVDLRSYVPALKNTAWRCENYILLIVPFTDGEQTVRSFLSVNSGKIDDFLRHGLCPSDLVEELGTEADLSSHFSRHTVSVDDGDLSKTTENKVADSGFEFPSRKCSFAEMSSETSLDIKSGSSNTDILLKFSFNTKLISETHGAFFFSSFLNLIKLALNNPTSSLSSLTERIEANRVVSTDRQKEKESLFAKRKPTNALRTNGRIDSSQVMSRISDDGHLQTDGRILLEGYFDKLTENGWSHRRYVCVVASREDGLCVCWGPKPGELTKQLQLKTVGEYGLYHFGNYNSSIVFVTRCRTYLFSSYDKNLLEEWMTVLSTLLSKDMATNYVIMDKKNLINGSVNGHSQSKLKLQT